jgi:Replication-relaxation
MAAPDSSPSARRPLRPGLALWRSDLAGAPIVYDSPRRRQVPQLQARDMEIMRALWRYTYLTTSQIGDTWWSDRHPSRVQIRLTELAGAELLARFRPLVKRGTHQWIYQLARVGFRAAQRAYGPEGTYIAEDARWSERRAADMTSVEQILRVNGWMLAYRFILGERLLDWRGPRDERHTDVTPDALAVIDVGSAAAPLELLVEVAREERPVRLAERLRRYDALLSGGRPAAVFVARGYREVERLLRAADAVVAGGRARLLVCAEPDLHRGDPRAWMLPQQAPEQRRSASFTAIEVTLPA